MSERSKKISKLIEDRSARESYIRSKLSVLIPTQLRTLRLRRGKTQAELGSDTEMKQARISRMEQVGLANLSVETLIRLAASLRVGLKISFVPFSEMLAWENHFEPDQFDVTPVEDDIAFTASSPLRANGRSEYLLQEGVCDPFVGHVQTNAVTVTLAPDVADAFPDADAVNNALRALIKAGRSSVSAA